MLGSRNVPPSVAIHKKNLLLELDLFYTIQLLSMYNWREAPAAIKSDNYYVSPPSSPRSRSPSPPPSPTPLVPVQSFWDSEFFRDSLRSGEFLALDPRYFAEQLLAIISDSDSNNKDNSSRNSSRHYDNDDDHYDDDRFGSNNNNTNSDKAKLMELVATYVAQQSFRDLCQKLLVLLPDNDLLYFIYHLSQSQQLQQQQQQQTHYIDNFINVTVLCEPRWTSVEDVLLYNAIVNYGRQFLRLVLQSVEEKGLKNGKYFHHYYHYHCYYFIVVIVIVIDNSFTHFFMFFF